MESLRQNRSARRVLTLRYEASRRAYKSSYNYSIVYRGYLNRYHSMLSLYSSTRITTFFASIHQTSIALVYIAMFIAANLVCAGYRAPLLAQVGVRANRLCAINLVRPVQSFAYSKHACIDIVFCDCECLRRRIFQNAGKSKRHHYPQP